MKFIILHSCIFHRSNVINHNISYAARLQNYNEFVKNTPKLKIDSTTFQYSIKKLQEYFKIIKYWKNGNKNKKKQNFLENFFVQKWYYFPQRNNSQLLLN